MIQTRAIERDCSGRGYSRQIERGVSSSSVAGGPQLLILGGGYVPITITGKLRRQMKRGDLRVTVVSRENFHAFHGFVGEMVTGRVSPGI